MFQPVQTLCSDRSFCAYLGKIVALRRNAFENLKMRAIFYMMEICTYKKQIATRGYYGRPLAFNEGNLHLSWRHMIPISRWIANYDMPSMKMGKCWKFKKDHIEAWLAKGGPEKSRKKFNNE